MCVCVYKNTEITFSKVALSLPLAGVFVICWTPGFVVLLLDGLQCEKCNLLKFKRWFLLLAVLNSVMNPIIYSYKDNEMWVTIKNLLRCVYNGTRRQRSSRANTRATTSSTEMSTSLRHSIERKTTQDIQKT